MNLKEKILAQFPTRLVQLSQELGTLAQENKVGAVIVGGGIRDLILNWEFEEADFMLESPSEAVVSEFAKRHNAKLIQHDRFRTYNLFFPDGLKLDITTARKETYASPAKLPDVAIGPEIKIADDLIRRDFSINTLAVWITPSRFGELLDIFNGRKDLQKKVIRALHAKSFIDDPTRIFRAARFAGRYGFTVEAETLDWIGQSIEQKIPSHLSPVRRRHEFDLVLKEKKPLPVFEWLIRLKALPFVHPGWNLSLSDVRKVDFSTPDPDERLARWLSLFGAEQARLMLSDLAYEKKTKKNIEQWLV